MASIAAQHFAREATQRLVRAKLAAKTRHSPLLGQALCDDGVYVLEEDERMAKELIEAVAAVLRCSDGV